MKSDGTIWIDTKIDDSGMEEGFNRIRDGVDDVAVSARKAAASVNGAFSKINVNKAVANAEIQLRSLETQFEAISREYANAIEFDDDKSAERLSAKRTKLYDRIAKARDKLAVEVAAAAEKEATAEEKASQRAAEAAQREADAKRYAITSKFDGMGNSAQRFNNRLRGIVASAFVFNLLSSGLRKVTSYFGTALMANNQFANAVYRLQGSLMVAFQPIYEAVLPALIAMINWLNIAVQAVARFFSILAGKSYKDMQSNAQNLGNTMNAMGGTAGKLDDTAESVGDVGDAIKDTGKEAKKAEKYLAGFDEINRLLKEDAADAADNLGNLADNLGNAGAGQLNTGGFTGPVFDDVELPKEWETAIDKLAMRFKDIFFEWDDLNAENVTMKLLTALTALAGGLIGFVLGGPGGAVIGVIVGAGLGVVLSALIFDGDGKLSAQELLHTLIIAMGIIGGGMIGFAMGGLGGAAIGITIGAGLTIMLTSWIFDSDGNLSEEELTSSLIVVLGAAIGLITFTAAGPVAGLIGATAGVAMGFVIKKLAFNNDGVLNESEVTMSLVAALGAVGAAISFFALHTVGAAAIGATVGIAIGFAITSIVFNGDGELDKQELLSSLIIALGTIFGGAIGFFLSGGNILGGAVGAAIGAAIGLAISFAVQRVEFDEVEKEYDGLNKKVGQASDQATKTTEDRYIKPTSTGIKNLQQEMTTAIEQSKDNIVSNLELTTNGAETTFFEPMTKMSSQLAEKMTSDNDQVSKKVALNWKNAADEMTAGFVEPTKQEFEELTKGIEQSFEHSKDKVMETWRQLPSWFRAEITEPMEKSFDKLMDGVIDRLKQVSETVNSAIKNMSANYDRIISTYNEGIRTMASAYESARRKTSSSSYTSTSNTYYSNISYPTAEVPMLARGAVIPPNHRFLAVLGDQTRGTNIEAPLATIQEAVALVMEDMIQSNLAGNESIISLLQQILEAVLGIELDGETLSNAVANYNRKMSVVKGGSF